LILSLKSSIDYESSLTISSLFFKRLKVLDI